ncbi:hypothetical protein VP01_8187g2 [Puccinia sorghi]|uniref:Uncharacterized protein n=1 Tax=Puccinia sorghi TaxID=27349 RepID=A0A0L6UA20_9BASI|nr:hypothetical protein VP01_8187g2 [Puccinia sorghi]
MSSSTSLVNPQESTELVKHYLRVLKLRKDEYILNYKPTDWEILTREDQIILAAITLTCDKNDLEKSCL